MKSTTLLNTSFSTGIGNSRYSAMSRICLVFLAFVACLATVFAFNLDVKDPFIYRGTSGEYFGYSVALHRQRIGPKW